MQAQDATTLYFLKLWPRIEANKNRIFAGIGVVAVAVGVFWFLSMQRDQKETAAAQALTKLTLTQGAMPESFLKVAADYAGTTAAQRALVQGAGMLFVAGKYADAQTQFQKYLDDHPDGEFSGQASLGLAASLEAQGKMDIAAGAYQRAIDNSSDPMVQNVAKLAMAKIAEAQGKFSNAQMYYQEVIRGNQNNSLGQEAMLRLMELKNKMPAAPATPMAPTTPTAPSKTVAPIAPAVPSQSAK